VSDEVGGNGVPEEIVDTDQENTTPTEMSRIIIDPGYLTDCAIDSQAITRPTVRLEELDLSDEPVQPTVNRAPTAPILDEKIQDLIDLSLSLP
jgi:hypothetical protein